MTFIMWLIVGGILGWLASIVMKTNDKQGIFLNIVVGVVGAFLGGLLLAPLLHTGTINQGDFSMGSLFALYEGYHKVHDPHGIDNWKVTVWKR